VAGEVVDRSLDGLALREVANVLDKKFALQRVGMVEVALVALVERKLRKVAIVEIQRKESRAELRCEFTGQRGLAGAGASGDADQDGKRRCVRVHGS
jgi:hypothetical protein